MIGTLARLPLAVRILVALLAGVLVGILLPKAGAAAASDMFAHVVTVAGQLWLSALQMTVLPLVFALLVTGLSSQSGVRDSGLVAKRAMFVFGALYLFSLGVTLGLNWLLLQAWPVPAATIKTFRNFGASAVQVKAPDVWQILLGIVPSNVFGALAAGAMLPVVVFAILFGLAMRQIEKAPRDRLIGVVDSIADVMFKIVEWVLLIAPLGVFGLVVGTVHETGLEIIWGLAGYLRYNLTIIFVMLLLSYPVALIWGRVWIGKFARAAAPSQLVAVSTQSSVASLPVMLESAAKLGIEPEVASVTLPLAASIFRFGGPVGTFSAAVYAAAATGQHLGFPSLIVGALLALLMEFAAVGLPNQVNVVALYAPVFAALGAPLGILPVILAVDPIPDAIGTTANVSMDIAATAVIDRLGRRGSPFRRSHRTKALARA